MRTTLIALVLLISSTCTLSAQTITPDEAAKHIGEKLTVCGKVFGGKYFDKSDNPKTVLNMGAPFPNSTFTILIEEDVRKKMKDKPEEFYVNKELCVTGKIIAYRGKPEIVIDKASDIVLKTKE